MLGLLASMQWRKSSNLNQAVNSLVFETCIRLCRSSAKRNLPVFRLRISSKA